MEAQPGRRERKRNQTRQAIFRAAIRLFSEKGFDNVTIAEIAESADVSINTVFNHFGTKEELFFSSGESLPESLARFVAARLPGEPVVAFLRRHIQEQIPQIRESLSDPSREEFLAVARQIIQQSAALQVHAAYAGRGQFRRIEEDLTDSLASDAKAGRNDIKPRLVAAQMLGLMTTLYAEVERRRRAGQSPAKITAALKIAAKTALEMLEHGIGDYGRAAT
jgi:AcrR family transcriptional regulator